MDIIPTERKNIYILVRNTYVVHINTLAQSSKKTVESMIYKNLGKRVGVVKCLIPQLVFCVMFWKYLGYILLGG